MTTLHYGKLLPTAFASTTAQAGYLATNLGNESLGRPWRSTGVALENVTLTLGAAAFVRTVFFHDVNFDAVTIQRSADGVNFVNVGVANAVSDDYGRYRGKIDVGVAGIIAIRFQIAAGATNDGLGYRRMGAAYLFGSSLVLPVGPTYNYRVRTKRPRSMRELPNGITSVAALGSYIDEIELPFDRRNDQSLRDLRTRAAQGTTVLTTDNTDWPAQMWPVRYIETVGEETYYKVHKAQATVRLVEVV